MSIENSIHVMVLYFLFKQRKIVCYQQQFQILQTVGISKVQIKDLFGLRICLESKTIGFYGFAYPNRLQSVAIVPII